jgi:protein gp37
MKEEWARRIISQCQQAEVAVFYKQNYQNGKIVKLPTIDRKQYAEFPRITGKRNGN